MSVDALVSYIVNKIGDIFTQQIPPIWKAADEVESLKQELQLLETFLHGMDYKQRQDTATKIWLSHVRDVVYEAEELIDTYLIGQGYAYASPFRLFNSCSVQKKIESLISKIHTIFEQRTTYVPNLHEQRSEGSSSGAAADQRRLHPWRRSSRHLGDDVVVGLEQDANLIVERLLNPERRRQVVAITGMGGAGKTTLAAVVYNSISKGSRVELQNHFDVCAWVPVHQNFQIIDFLSIMADQLDQLRASRFEFNAMNWNHLEERINVLMENLYYNLRETRYLIVLDDIWRKEVWDQLRPALPDSGNGSRIIVTTRFRDVAIYHDPDSEPHEMRLLKEDDSWRLFLTKIFPQLTPHDQPIRPRELDDLGRQLCGKCAGLPLALVVLGGLVSTEMRDPLVWLELLNNMNWDSTDDGRQCLEILALSYYDLPYYMKFYFLYLGAFPQNSQISASKLTKMWIGDDLIPEKTGAILEYTATNYLKELAQRCMVEIVKRGADKSIKKVRVHDLLGELAKSEARESQFLQVQNLTTTEEMSKLQEIGACRMALHQSPDILKEILDEKLRALLVFPTSGITQTSSNDRNEIDIRMELLRVLELGGFARNGILKLTKTTRLRYLGLRNTKFTRLLFPKEIPTHLQTLDIRGTTITELPSQVWTLSELRHLYLNSTSLLNSQALRNMQKTLSESASAKRIKMSCMHNLQTLKIDAGRDTPNTTDSTLFEFLKLLTSLNSLTLRTEEIPQEVFKATSTHANLYELKLDGTLQPDELCDIKCFAPHLTELILSRSNLKGEPTRTLGRLKNLKILKLTDNACQCPEISCSPDNFPNLSYLKLSNLSQLESLNIEHGSFPNLMHLSIHCCNNLHAVPNGLNHITALEVLRCKKMPSSFEREIRNLPWMHRMRVIIQTTSSREIIEVLFDAGADSSEN